MLNNYQDYNSQSQHGFHQDHFNQNHQDLQKYQQPTQYFHQSQWDDYNQNTPQNYSVETHPIHEYQYQQNYQEQQQPYYPEDHHGYDHDLVEEVFSTNRLKNILQTDLSFTIQNIADEIREMNGYQLLIFKSYDSKKKLIEFNTTNNVSFPSSSNQMYKVDNVILRSLGEVKVYFSLVKRGVMIFPNCLAVIGEEKTEPDYIVQTKKGNAILDILNKLYS
ncbi:hypothetical protein IQ283_08305 (plasmid) [Alkalihalobacillus hwajinpoensis]|uniref:hypothetical protein n=1 Tax=Guptibacillus hwajinpoensis TaxID=208199 RepID=UPI001883B672|nr:hypothetical protein [Pseudalkalibacillus hwajinpoensis]MBF0706611.1 hypothetical protein [Pseudalkalibacillus hwajinpoensis]